MFLQKVNEITHQINGKYQRRTDYLKQAIKVWCNHLDISHSQDISDYILRGYDQSPEMQKIVDLIWQESPKENEVLKNNLLYQSINPFYRYTNALLNRLNIGGGTIKLIVLIAFGITAVGFCLYKISQEQQISRRGKHLQNHSVNLSPKIQINRQFLVLVVSALQADFIESLKAQRHINYSDGESLYEITKYLWLSSEVVSPQQQANIKQYEVSKKEESEYDIHLIYIELSQADKGFKSNVNQLDRYDAFRKLGGLVVDFDTSPRLRMEAYENFEVYSR